ncbi:hypothetical protein E3G59_001577 [Mycobacteroides abscessus]|uniref:helix-turn-helix domain-containing protein n=3 Tax=Mycobacteroides abscessus TaxID=36809 RepID=UPI000449580A|nr:helix-turn-helix domain-containing protein [Mycobacteroides abscessus]ETZ64365.1 hypothetical protein L836_1446 [Mycobacteroides abscessus MAB_110811_2726]EUA83392.1 hypothetical protein I541_0171 [Mycobacteroides abscessus]KNB68290.1 hypothetical protein MAUC95_01015 [Mycobacteroides abscessus]MBE5415039.1 hypothetical protein [Mycobacteroides abscessus]MBN7351941.1 helix-turn-helix domain containing protein [Mycobacteroides abscessus subsp. abscessus]
MSDVAAVVDEHEVVQPLSREDAEQLDKRIRLAAGQFVADWVKFQGLIDDARRGQVHLTLGYPSWTAYVAEVGQDLLALPTANAEVRREVLEWLSSTGMSLRAIAQVAGLSKSTVGRELSAVPSGTPDASGSAEPQASANDLAQGSNYGHVDSGGDQSAVPSGTPADEQKTVGLDGKEYRKPKPRKKPEPKPKQKEPKLEPVAEPESVSTRRVQIPTAFRAEADAVQQHARALHDLTTDPRWGKAFPRIAKADHDWLDDTIATLEGIRVLMCHEPVPAGSENSEAITSALDEESGQSPTDPRPESETADRSGPTEPDLSTPSGPVEPEVVQPVAETPPPVRPTNCGRCNVDLPASATSPLCDDCDGAPEAPARDTTEPPAVVIHNESINKRSHERRRFGARKVTA